MHRLALATVMVCACQETRGTGRSDETRHPDVLFVRGANARDPTISLNASPEDRDTVLELPRSIAFQLGAAAEPPDQVFGSVSDVARDDAGRIFILDSRLNQVSVFDSSGHRVDLVGGSGRGPGEFLRARALVVSGDTLLYVGDRSEQVHIFGLSAGRFEYRSSIGTPISADALCLLNGDLYVHGASPIDSLAIHHFDRTGRHVGAFATVYRSPHPRANMEAMRGRIACSEELGLIAYAPEGMLGEVRVFSPSGDQVWRLEINGFRPVDVIATPTEFAVRLPASGFNRIDGLVWLPDSSLLVQVAHLVPDGAGGDSGPVVQKLISIRIEAQSGRARRVGNELPVLRAVSRSAMLSTAEDPYPAVSVWH